MSGKTRTKAIADLTVEELRARLTAAEQVCLLVSWTASRMETSRDKALYEVWSAWHDFPGVSTDPRDHPEMGDERIEELAAKRDATRARVLARLSGEAS